MAFLAANLLLATSAFAQVEASRDPQASAQSMQHLEKLKQLTDDKASFVAAIVSRWERAARESGKFDENYTIDLSRALMKLPAANLLAAGEASSYEEVRSILARGPRGKGKLASGSREELSPRSLGDLSDDLVYTPVPACRLVDTRVAGGPIPANTTKSYDADGSTFAAQGGFNGSCGVPFGVARAVAVTIHAVGSTASGSFLVWPLDGVMPTVGIMNFSAGQAIATGTILAIEPGTGADFFFRTTATSQVAIDVVGYFAAPTATELDCTSVASAATAVPVNAWTPVDVSCPTGTVATGGGFDTTEGTLGFPGVWVTSVPNGDGWRAWVDNQTNGPRHVLTWARCCRVPGR